MQEPTVFDLGVCLCVLFLILVAVEEVVGKVKSLLTTSQEWEQKAKAALKQK